MKILFIHNNFPAQFGSFGGFLAQEGWDVTFLTQKKGARAENFEVVVYRDRPLEDEGVGVHPFLVGSNHAMVKGASALEVFGSLKARGYEPDIVVAHSGWGPGMFVKDAWPRSVYIAYVEWFYDGDGADLNFLGQGDLHPMARAHERMQNVPILTDLVACDAAIVPTQFQADRLPVEFHSKIHVMHDGIDTNGVAPGDAEPMELGGVAIHPGDEVLTYVARGMEPYRGFPEFMRAVETLQASRPDMKVIVLGDDRVAYGQQLPIGDSWKQRMLAELDLDLGRIAFPGLVPRQTFVNVLRLSSVHCYMTVPFVLSWSLMEAMSAGCLIAASDTAPVKEVIENGVHGALFDMRSKQDMVSTLETLLNERSRLQGMGRAARRRILDHFSQRDHFAAKKLFLSQLASDPSTDQLLRA